jgi:hypothetical protein
MDPSQDNQRGVIDQNPFSPEAMAVAARLLSTEAEQAKASEAISSLSRDGYCVIEGVLDDQQLAAVRKEVDHLNEQTPASGSSFGGSDTLPKRTLTTRSSCQRPRRSPLALAKARRCSTTTMAATRYRVRTCR